MTSIRGISMIKKLTTSILLLILLCSCRPKEWHTVDLTADNESSNNRSIDYDGEITESLKDWEVIADISDSWFPCNHGFVLLYTKISMDKQNNIWIYGPDLWRSPFGICPDSMGCEGDTSSRVIVFDFSSGQIERIRLKNELEPTITSASGWTHLDDGQVLLSNVELIATAWDEGAYGNAEYSLAVLWQDEIYPLSEEGSVYGGSLDYSLHENTVYSIFSLMGDAEIRVFDLETEQMAHQFVPAECEKPRSIEYKDEELFVVCWDGDDNNKLNIYDNDFSLTNSIVLEEEYRRGVPLAFDTNGNLWIGYSYIAYESAGQWVVEKILQDEDFSYQYSDETYQRRIIKMIPYKGGMFFNLDGAFYVGDYEKKEWKKIIHNSGALAVAEGMDGKLYVFTGKYILAGEP